MPSPICTEHSILVIIQNFSYNALTWSLYNSYLPVSPLIGLPFFICIGKCQNRQIWLPIPWKRVKTAWFSLCWRMGHPQTASSIVIYSTKRESRMAILDSFTHGHRRSPGVWWCHIALQRQHCLCLHVGYRNCNPWEKYHLAIYLPAWNRDPLVPTHRERQCINGVEWISG